jgi:alkaline phosphatase D
MKKTGPTRRAVLELGALAAISSVIPGCKKDTGEDTADTGEPWVRALVPSNWLPGGTENLSLFPLGIQSGDPLADGAVCWTQYLGDVGLVLKVAGWDGEQWTEAASQDCSVAAEGIVHHLIQALPEDAWYSFYFEDADGERSAVGRFRTPPEQGFPVVVFGGVSCTRQSFQPFPPLIQGAKEDVDFVFLAGDQVYTSQGDVDVKRSAWQSNLASQGYRDLLASTSVIATWDDHEVSNDWGTDPISEDEVVAGVQAFHEHTPTRTGMGAPIYRSLRWADTLEIFVLDGRSERNRETGEYLSAAQFSWFVDAIQQSTAHFKLILNSVPFADFSDLLGAAQLEDRWGGFPEARQAMLDALVGIENVFFISGDFHMGLVCHVQSEGPGWDMYDILVGPGGQIPNPVADLMAPNPQFPEGISAPNFTRMVANPRNNTLSVEYLGESGDVLAAIVLPEAS